MYTYIHKISGILYDFGDCARGFVPPHITIPLTFQKFLLT